MICVYDEFEKRWRELFRFLNGKKIIIWGYGMQGKIIESYCKQQSRKIAAIIDSNNTCEGRIVLPHLLRNCNPNICVILLAVSGNVEDILRQADNYGFSVDRDNLIIFREFFYGHNDILVDYYSWAERNLENINFESSISREQLGYNNKNYNIYSSVRGVDLRKVLSQFSFSSEDAVFDYGCGRGAALSMFCHMGVKKLGGVELSNELYDSAKYNLEKMNIKADIVLGDATSYKQIDDYNFFYIFDSFRDSVFRKVIDNICESYRKRKRKIYLIYSVPYEHRIVMESGEFELVDTVSCFGGCLQSANIYVTK